MGKKNSTIKGKVSNGVITFEFAEVKNGKRREIKVWIEGKVNSIHTYGISPEPHDNPSYNKNQTKFYQTAASKIASYYAIHESTFPPIDGTESFTFKQVSHNLVTPR